VLDTCLGLGREVARDVFLPQRFAEQIVRGFGAPDRSRLQRRRTGQERALEREILVDKG